MNANHLFTLLFLLVASLCAVNASLPECHQSYGEPLLDTKIYENIVLDKPNSLPTWLHYDPAFPDVAQYTARAPMSEKGFFLDAQPEGIHVFKMIHGPDKAPIVTSYWVKGKQGCFITKTPSNVMAVIVYTKH